MSENVGHGMGVSELPTSRLSPYFFSPSGGNFWSSLWFPLLEPNLVPKTGTRPAQTLHLPNMPPPLVPFSEPNLVPENGTKFGWNFGPKRGFWMQLFSRVLCSISGRRSTERCRGPIHVNFMIRSYRTSILTKLVACRHSFFLTRIVCLHWHRTFPGPKCD